MLRHRRLRKLELGMREMSNRDINCDPHTSLFATAADSHLVIKSFNTQGSWPRSIAQMERASIDDVPAVLGSN